MKLLEAYMNKLLLVAALFFISLLNNSYALSFKVYGPCHDAPLFEHNVKVEKEISVGKLTVMLFDEFNIPYIGAEPYMQSIFNSPFGLEAMEVLSDTQMRSHGFIFSVSGVVPTTYPHEVFVTNEDTVIWYYGYVEYDRGQWGSEYLYTNKIKPAQFCK